jgi:hypothetical protein
MDNFQKIVLGISLFLLVFILIGVGVLLSATTNNQIFPPVQHPCPDGWNTDSLGNCYYVGKNGGTAITQNGVNASIITDPKKGIPVNDIFPLYNATFRGNTVATSGDITFPQSPPIPEGMTSTVVFSSKDPKWITNGGQAICSQQKFANQYNIYWDGVSNTNQCTSS